MKLMKIAQKIITNVHSHLIDLKNKYINLIIRIVNKKQNINIKSYILREKIVLFNIFHTMVLISQCISFFFICFGMH